MAFNVKGITVEIGANATELTATLEAIKKEYSGLDKMTKSFSKSMYEGMSSTDRYKSAAINARILTEGIEKQKSTLNAYSKTLSNFDANAAQWKADAEAYKAKADTYGTQASNLKNIIDRQTITVNKANSAYQKNASFLAQIEQNAKTYSDTVVNAEKKLTTLNNKQSKLDKLYSSGKITQETYTKATSETTAAIKLTTSEREAAIKSLDKENDSYAWMRQITANTKKDLDDETAALQALNAERATALNQQEKNLNLSKQSQTKYDNRDQSKLALEAAEQEAQNKLSKLKKEYATFVAENSSAYQLTQKMQKGFKTVSTAAESVAKTLKIPALISAGALTGAVKTTIDFESAWVGVTKTVSGSQAEMELLNDGLKDLAQNTASTYEELASYAQMAGQMGVATENVLSFTEVIAKLSDTTNLEGEDAAQTIAKFANVMGDSKDENGEVLMDYYHRLGSTVVDLGNNFATTESDIMAMSMRMAAAADIVGMTSPEVLALATTLSSLGLKTNAAGGAVSKVMQKIALAVAEGSDSLEDYANVMGITADEFSDKWHNSATGTILEFITAINELEEGDARLQALNDADMTSEIRTAQAMGSMASNAKLYADALAMANDAWAADTAMDIEAEKRYDTLETKIKQCWETVKSFANDIGELLVPSVSSFVDDVKSFTSGLAAMDDGQKQALINTGLWTVGLYGAAKGANVLFNGLADGTSILGKVVKGYKKFQASNDIVGAGLLTTADKLGSNIAAWASNHQALLGYTAVGTAVVGTALLIGNAIDKNTEQIKSNLEQNNAVFATNEKVIAQTDDIVAGVKAQLRGTEEITSAYVKQAETARRAWDELQKLDSQDTLTTLDKNKIQTYVDQLNSIFPDLNIAVDLDTGHIKGQREEIEAELDALISKANEFAKSQIMTDMQASVMQASTNLADVGNSLLTADSMWKKEIAKIQKENGNDIFGILNDSGKMNAYLDQRKELLDKYALSAQTYADAQAQLYKQINALDTGNANEIGAGLLESFNSLLPDFESTGVMFSQTLMNGITEGADGAITLSDIMGKIILLDSLQEQASDAGKETLQSYITGLTAGVSDLPSMSVALDDAIDFTLNHVLDNPAELQAQVEQEINQAIGTKDVDVPIKANPKIQIETDGNASDISSLLSSAFGDLKQSFVIDGQVNVETDAAVTAIGNVTAAGDTIPPNMAAAGESSISAGVNITTSMGGAATSVNSVTAEVVALKNSLDALSSQTYTARVNKVVTETTESSSDSQASPSSLVSTASLTFSSAPSLFSVDDALTTANPITTAIATQISNARLMTANTANNTNQLKNLISGISKIQTRQPENAMVIVKFDESEVARVLTPIVNSKNQSDYEIANLLAGVMV